MLTNFRVLLYFAKPFFTFFKRTVFVCVVLLSVVTVFLYLMGKDNPKNTQIIELQKQQKAQIYEKLKDPKLQQDKEKQEVIKVYRLVSCGFVGDFCTDNPDDEKEFTQKSWTGRMAGLISTPYVNPAASGIAWVQDGLRNAHLIPQTYAAEGIGFAAIRPFNTIWKVFRDLAFMLFVLFLIIVGFLIMFRIKLDPQTSIGIETALPRIVITLILITFSFAIAGFMIDAMYFLIAFSISVIGSADPSLNVNQLQNEFLNAKFGTIWDGMFPKNGMGQPLYNYIPGTAVNNGTPFLGGLFTLFETGDAIMGVLPSFINDTIKGVAALTFSQYIMHLLFDQLGWQHSTGMLNNISILGNMVGNLPEGLLGNVLRFLVLFIVIPQTLEHGGGWILGLLIALTMLYLLFRIFFMLLTAYIRIILLIIFSPLILLFEAIPGRNAFKFWITALAGDLMTFPIVVVLLVMARLLVNLNLSTLTWTPPFIYGIEPATIGILLGMGIIFIAPDLVKMAKEAMGVQGLPSLISMGTFFSGAGTGVGGALGLVTQYASIAHAFPGLATLMSNDKNPLSFLFKGPHSGTGAKLPNLEDAGHHAPSPPGSNPKDAHHDD